MNEFNKRLKKIPQSNDEAVLLRNDKKIISGLIITAGLSSRMESFKPLLINQEKTFLENIIQKLFLVCDEIIIVTGFKSNEIIKVIENVSMHMRKKINIINNENYELGMFTSLKLGIENSKNEWVLYHFIDQPNLPNEFYENFSSEIDDKFDWIQPIKKERKGHPILMSAKVKNYILKAEENSNLREISNNKKIIKKFWECDFEEIFTDIDTQNDYKKLKGK